MKKYSLALLLTLLFAPLASAGPIGGGGGSGGGGPASNSFETQNAPAGTDPVADSATDTLNLVATAPITITGNATTDTLTAACNVASGSQPGCLSSADWTTFNAKATLGANTYNGAQTIGTTVLTTEQQIDVLCSGNVTTTFQAAITALAAANGGVVHLSSGSCYSTAQITVPNDGASPAPHQKSIRIVGASSHFAGIASPINGGTTLDLQYAGTVGKIVTYGLGSLTLENITLTSTITTSIPFLYTTNTTLHVTRSAFIGASAASPLQDAIVLGGRGAVVTGDSTGYFQGYGTVIEGNYFDYVNRGVFLQKNANAVVVRDNSWWTNCAGTAAIEDWNDTSYHNAGLFTSGNLIEMNNYTYGIALYRTLGATLLGDNFYDAGGTFTSYYFFNSEANALPNLVIPGFYAAATSTKLASGAGAPALPITSAAGTLSLLDGAGGYTNSRIKTGRIEVMGDRVVLRAANEDDIFSLYPSGGHEVLMSADQSDGAFSFGDAGGNVVLRFANPGGTFTFMNNKPTGYTYWETRAGAGQSTIPLGRWKDVNGVTGTTVNSDGSFTFNSQIEGIEIADPPAPETNAGRLYFRDNGSGKTQIVVKFPTGAVQVIATEP